MSAAQHLGPMTLRRRRVGELDGDQRASADAHLAECAACRSRAERIEEEQRRFESEISFERFAAGVQRAARDQARRPRVLRAMAPLTALAASLVLAIGLGSLVDGDEQPGRNRLKGTGADVQLIVGRPEGGPQRFASPAAPEALSPGERVRVGYRAGGHRYIASVSIDEQGEVTRLYPESGKSLRAEAAQTDRYLPDSLEFTGVGLERVVVVLTDQPLDIAEVERAARAAYQAAGGRLQQLPALALPGEQFHRTVLKTGSAP